MVATEPSTTSSGASGFQSSAPPSPSSVVSRRSLVFEAGKLARHYPVPLGALILLIVSLGLWSSGNASAAQWPLIAIIVLGGAPMVWRTLNRMLEGELGVDFIAILAIVGSLALGEYLAGAFVVLMLSGGEALEAYALHRATSSLGALAERAPRTAHVRHNHELSTVPADEVEVGSNIVVKQGELVPTDGVVTGGSASVSESDLTGESMPVRKEEGAIVLSGSVNLDGMLEVRTTRRSAESQYAQIIKLVAEAQERKAPIHRLADRFAVVFTALTLVTAFAAWLFTRDMTYALAVLVVATPCPLILATPIAIMSGIDRAAHRGIIIKSGATMEQLGEVDVAVFDKTGTLTLGTPQLMELVPVPGHTFAPDESTALLRMLASVEQFSAHILARSVVETAKQRNLSLLDVRQFEEVPGKGISGWVVNPLTGREAHVALGNTTYMHYVGVALSEDAVVERDYRTLDGQIVSFLALDGMLSGLLLFADAPRPEIARLTSDMKAAGLERTILLTGDGETVARQVGNMAGVDQVVAHCLPAEKVKVVAELESQRHKVLMVGDGINDAPALALAKVGIAIGAQGLTASAAVADAVLLSPDILQVAHAVRIGRTVMRVALQGIFLGMGLSIVAMILAAMGFIVPAAGAILQEGIDVLVILNALRVLKA